MFNQLTTSVLRHLQAETLEKLKGSTSDTLLVFLAAITDEIERREV